MPFDASTYKFKMLINGELKTAQNTFDVVNPSTGKAFAKAPECSKEQLDEAMRAARAAFKAWSADLNARRAALAMAAELIQANADAMATILQQEQGKPLAKAQMEVYMSAALLQAHLGLELPNEVLFEDDDKKIELVYKPMGVVAAITPWNYPLSLAVFKIAPCLIAGNTLVLKPSPFTPLSTLKLAEIINEALPKGVLNVVSGSDELGAWMTTHPIPRKISFTGSVSTGKKIAAAAAADLKHLTLELGGNDVAIVLDDVDPAEVAPRIFWAAFENSGQVCIATKRVYAQEKIYDQLVKELAKYAQTIKVGDGAKEDSMLGPINNKKQFERVKELLSDAKAKGARFETGGEVIGDGGYFITPAIITNVAEGVRIVDEEQFGPALPVMKFKTVEEVIERTNTTTFGLGGSVWSNNLELAREIAGKIETGTVWINQNMDLSMNAPFGGVKSSGQGRELGIWGLKAYCDQVVINTSKMKVGA